LYSSGPIFDFTLFSDPRKAAFHATRLTSSTFLVKEYNDIYSEHPHIYAKVVPVANTILVIDTGCGGASHDPEIQVKSLREFIETVGVADNDGEPLNPKGGYKYVVVTTHCHYDHILGIEHFTKDSPIIASSHSPEFLLPSALPNSSLCRFLNIQTPSYSPILVPHLHALVSPNAEKLPLDVIILHTPGHTPDELALYDEVEMMLYVGDSLYEYEPIIFPKDGSIITWFTSMAYLISFVNKENNGRHHKGSGYNQVLINSGHRTVLRPALEVLSDAETFMDNVVDGMELVKERTTVQGEVTVTYEQEGGRFSLRCPERLVLDARRSRRG